MGVYEQGASNSPPEPVMGHPLYPPLSNYTSYEQQQPQQQQLSPPAPPAVVPYPESYNTEEWATKLCGCCSDCDLCCQTCWCPCVSFGQIAEIVDGGQPTCATQGAIYGLFCSLGVPCVYSFLWRLRLRRKFRLEKGPCGDFCVHCCCETCALCQEHRELQRRGLDPSLGWEVAKQHLGRTMDVPTPQGGMLR